MARLERVQSRHVVGEGSGSPAHPPLQTAEMDNSALYHARLSAKTYLTVEELTDYLSFPSERACRMWITRRGIPKCRRGGRTLLVLRRDVDEAVQPGNQSSGRRPRPALVRSHEHAPESGSESSARKGHAR